MKEYQDKAAERQTERSRARRKDRRRRQQQQRHRVQAAVATQRGSPDEGCGSSRVDNKGDGEHPEDPEREDGKWMRTEGNKRNTVEEGEESMLKGKL